LVCRKWRDSILQVPVSITASKYTPKNMEHLPSLFNIKSLTLSNRGLLAYERRYDKLISRCRNLSELIFIKGNLTDLISYVPNPQLLQCIKTKQMNNFPFEKLVNLKHLKYVFFSIMKILTLIFKD
jgi:hypothetical protein